MIIINPIEYFIIIGNYFESLLLGYCMDYKNQE